VISARVIGLPATQPWIVPCAARWSVVTFIAPFSRPAHRDKNETYIINFNLKANGCSMKKITLSLN